jgi:hypothetical protein
VSGGVCCERWGVRCEWLSGGVRCEWWGVRCEWCVVGEVGYAL